VADRTTSIWTHILMMKPRFLNGQYQPQGIIEEIPVTSHLNLVEWRFFFFRWSMLGQTTEPTIESHNDDGWEVVNLL